MSLHLQDMRCFVLDMDGTLYLGERVIPGARELLAFFDERDIAYFFFTNNSSKSPSEYKAKLKRLGFSSSPRVITSADVAADYVKKTYGSRPRAYVVGTPALTAQLAAAGVHCIDEKSPDYASIDCVLVGFDTTFDYNKAALATDLLRRGVPFLATNIDAVCPLEDGKVLPDCGSICALLTHATGIAPKFLGKPSAQTAAYIQKTAGISSDKIAVVGDRLYTDMRLALDNGMCAVGVLSGEMTQADIDAASARPHHVFGSVEDIWHILADR